MKQSKVYKSVFKNQVDQQDIILKKKASRKVQYERRKSIKSNLTTLYQLRTKESREKNDEQKKRIRAQMNEISNQIDDMEKIGSFMVPNKKKDKFKDYHISQPLII